MQVKFMHHAACLQSSVMEPCSVISPVSKPVHGPELWKGTMAQRCWRSQECVLWLLPPINALLEDEVAAICLSTKYSQAAYSCAEIKVLFSSDKCHKGRWLPMRRWGVIHSSRSPSPQTLTSPSRCSRVCQSKVTGDSYVTAPRRCRHERWKTWHVMKC